MPEKIVRCCDCGKDYDDFGLDMVLTHWQWKRIVKEDGCGILCANCIVKRASKFPEAIAVLATIDFMPDSLRE